MKTVPTEKEYHDIEMQDDSFPETKITRSILNVAKKTNYQSNIKDNVVNDSLIHSESDTLIICSPDLAASFQNPKTEKHKLSPGHYLQKVFLNSVAQKFRSQSLPSCLEKKKYQKNSVSDASNLDELNETSVPLVQQAESLITNIDARESFTEGWFKTWPERGIDKIPIRKGEEFCDDKVSNETSVSDDFVPDLVGNELQSNSQNTSKTQFQLGSKVEESLSSVSKESEVSKESLSNGDSEVLGNIDTKDKLHCTKTPGNSKSIPLDELLGNFPLAYSPITRQLLLITNSEKIPNQYSNLECNDTSKEIIRPNREDNSNLEETVSDKLGGGNGWNSNSKNSECELSNNLHRVNRELSSFSSTVSSLSDTSPSTNEDSALGSLLDHGDTCSLVSFGGCSTFSEDSVGAKSKKKSLTGFLSRNVFNWKSGSRSDDSIAHSGAGWKLFSKNSSPVSSHSSLTVDHYAEADAWSTAPDSPCSVRSNSSAGPRTFTHESRVASSSALIQLDRPAHLPAKSEQEEARHRLEYQQMVEAARKKELKDAKLRKKQQQLQLRAEEQLAQAARVWTNEILPRWDQTHLSKKARELWWQGVPPCVRGKVWKLAIGNHLNLTHSLYDICVQRAQDRLSGGASSEDEDFDNKEDSMQLIQLDISRTFPHLCIFQKGGPYYDMLHCLLAAYVCYRPDVGYVQGMSFIAAVFILNMEAADAFVCFANLLNRPCHMAFFHLNQPLMQAYYSTYNELFKENLPQLFAHFTSTTLSPDLYLLDWIYTVFTKAMSLDLASRVWDVFLRDGEQFLFRTALGVLHLCQDSLLQMDFVHGSQFLTRLPDDLSGDQLFKSIACIKMTVGKQTFDDILAVHSIDCH